MFTIAVLLQKIKDKKIKLKYYSIHRDNFARRNNRRGQIMEAKIGGVRKIRSTIQQIKINFDVLNIECEIEMS